MIIDQIKEGIVWVVDALGLHPLLGLGITGLAVLSGIGLEALPSNNHPHFLQIISWIIASLVGLCTIFASLIKWTTWFDKIKWIKKDKQK